MKTKLLPVIIGFTSFCHTTSAIGHARFLTDGKLALRNTSAGNKTGPCGTGTRNTNPTVLKAGSTITVEWEETIQHPGYFVLQFSPNNDTGFDTNELARVTDTKNASNDLPHKYSKQITLPSTPCENCSLRLIQAMTEVPASPTFYYSCADIKLVNTGNDTSSTPKTGTSAKTSTEKSSEDSTSSPATDINCK